MNGTRPAMIPVAREPAWRSSGADSPAPFTRAVTKAQPEDFVVDEQLRQPPSGQGAHLWLRITKVDIDTQRLAGLLARAADLPRRAVGYAGLKDRRAVATQWFSLALESRPEPDWASVLPPGCRVVEAARSQRKLKIGGLTGNRFDLRLTQCEGPRELILARAAAVRDGGFANYFGSQRFGFDGGNLAAAWAMLCEGRRVKDRGRRGLLLSAARSHLFNLVLARRVADGDWDRALPGEVLMLDGSHSVFPADPAEDAEVAQRLAALDVHPTGPLWGEGGRMVGGLARDREDDVLAGWSALMSGLERARLAQARRALRVRVTDLEVMPEAAGPDGRFDLRLRFFLPAGSYATVLMEHLFDEVGEGERDAQRPSSD